MHFFFAFSLFMLVYSCSCKAAALVFLHRHMYFREFLQNLYHFRQWNSRCFWRAQSHVHNLEFLHKLYLSKTPDITYLHSFDFVRSLCVANSTRLINSARAELAVPALCGHSTSPELNQHKPIQTSQPSPHRRYFPPASNRYKTSPTQTSKL